jgi:predicted Zn-dependent peptidase
VAVVDVTADDVRLCTLDNGMRLVFESLPHLHSASLGVWIKTGSANETPEENGAAHFLEHLFFKGTKTRTTHEIMDAIEGRGGYFNAFTSRGYTCLYVRILAEHVPVAIEVLGDLIRDSQFYEMDKERGVILEEIASNEDVPDDYVHDLLSEYHWPDHALGRPVAGTEETVSAMTFDQINDFYLRWYTPGNMVFSISGNIDEDAVVKQVEDIFSDMPSRELPKLETPPAFHDGIKIYQSEISQAHVTLAFPGPHLLHKDRFVCDVTSSLLGGASTSRLFERIREDEGLAYAIQTFHAYYDLAGVIGVYAAVAPENYEKTLDLTFEEIRKLRESGATEDEVEKNKQQLKGAILMSLESTFARMSRIAKSLLYYDRVLAVDDLIERVSAVTPDDVQRFTQETFTADNCALVVLGKTGGAMVERAAL